MSLADLPAVNACLNGLSAIFLGAGYYFIRRKNRVAHRNCMIAAFAASTLFLACYLTYHGYLAYYLHRGPDRLQRARLGSGPIYLGILLTHTVLAVVIVPLALITLWRALAAAVRAAQEDRPLDLAVLDVRLRDRRADLPPALPDLPAEIGRRFEGPAIRPA